jgi:hypothetical protein
MPLHVAVEWLALLLRIWKGRGSDLGPEFGYTNWDFSFFSSVPTGKCWYLELSYDRFLPHPFQFIIHPTDSVQPELLTALLSRPHINTTVCHLAYGQKFIWRNIMVNFESWVSCASARLSMSANKCILSFILIPNDLCSFLSHYGHIRSVFMCV